MIVVELIRLCQKIALRLLWCETSKSFNNAGDVFRSIFVVRLGKGGKCIDVETTNLSEVPKEWDNKALLQGASV